MFVQLDDETAEKLRKYCMLTDKTTEAAVKEAVKRLSGAYDCDEGFPRKGLIEPNYSKRYFGAKPGARVECIVMKRQKIMGDMYFKALVDERVVSLPIKAVELAK